MYHKATTSITKKTFNYDHLNTLKNSKFLDVLLNMFNKDDAFYYFPNYLGIRYPKRKH